MLDKVEALIEKLNSEGGGKMFNSGKRKEKIINKVADRLKILLATPTLQKMDKKLPKDGVEAIVCNDGIVLLNLDKKGFAVSMIKDAVKVEFSLNLTAEEMQEFNGGSGLRERYFPYGN